MRPLGPKGIARTIVSLCKVENGSVHPARRTNNAPPSCELLMNGRRRLGSSGEKRERDSVTGWPAARSPLFSPYPISCRVRPVRPGRVPRTHYRLLRYAAA
uniref:Uncharacterized protein n=1 Tax=Plectus sambesii TaxID=2011161 RepID=A0A914USJ8_9BILA